MSVESLNYSAQDMNASIAENDVDGHISKFEDASLIGLPVVSITGALYAADAYGYADLPAINSIPGMEHSSSATGGYFFGMVGILATEKAAQYLIDKGYPKSGEKIRSIGVAATFLGSLVTQVAIETSARGVADKWDVLTGIVATAPGVLAGRATSKS